MAVALGDAAAEGRGFVGAEDVAPAAVGAELDRADLVAARSRRAQRAASNTAAPAPASVYPDGVVERRTLVPARPLAYASA